MLQRYIFFLTLAKNIFRQHQKISFVSSERLCHSPSVNVLFRGLKAQSHVFHFGLPFRGIRSSAYLFVFHVASLRDAIAWCLSVTALRLRLVPCYLYLTPSGWLGEVTLLKFDKWLKGSKVWFFALLRVFQKVWRTERDRRGRKPPYLWTIKQSPEGATDSR